MRSHFGGEEVGGQQHVHVRADTFLLVVRKSISSIFVSVQTFIRTVQAVPHPRVVNTRSPVRAIAARTAVEIGDKALASVGIGGGVGAVWRCLASLQQGQQSSLMLADSLAEIVSEYALDGTITQPPGFRIEVYPPVMQQGE